VCARLAMFSINWFSIVMLKFSSDRSLALAVFV
jgi:hypothetical protein